MTWLGKLARSLSFGCGLCCLGGCSGRILDLDHGAPTVTNTAPSLLPKGEATSVWVDDQRLYWLTYDASGSKSYHSCLKLDCEHTTLTYTTLTNPTRGGNSSQLELDERSVYWTDSASRIFSCPIEGCAEPLMITQDPSLPGNAIVVNRGYVYWRSDFDLVRCPASGCAATPEVVARSTVTDLLGVDGARIYWHAEGAVFSAASDGSEQPQVVARPSMLSSSSGDGELPDQTQDLAVGGGYLYWTTPRQVFRCPVANCMAGGATLLTTTDDAPSSFKIDGSAMYWIEADAVHSCPLSGCQHSLALTPQNVRQFPDGPGSAAHYAVDASTLYWVEAPPNDTDQWKGKIRMTAK